MVRPRRCRVLVLVSLVACTFDTSGFGTDDTLVVQPSTGEPPDPGGTLMTSGQISDGQISGLDAATSSSGPLDDDEGNSSDGSESSSTSEDESSTGEPTVTEARLSHVDFGRCDDHVWCEAAITEEPLGGPVWLQECFKSPVRPPYRIAALDMIVDAVAPELGPFNIEIRQIREDDGRPGDGLWFGVLSLGDEPSPGPFRIAFSPVSPVVDEPGFCVGFFIASPGLPGALGIAVDDEANVDNTSYAAGCGLPQFTDLADLSSPPRNWCLAVDIEAVQN